MYKRILVGIDGSEPAAAALHEAVTLAREQKSQVRLLYILDLRPMLSARAPILHFDDLLSSWEEGAQRLLRDDVEAARAAGVEVEAVTMQTETEPVANVIVDAAREWGADLIVLGTHGRHGLERLMLGSVAENVVRQSPVPVLLLHQPSAHAPAQGTETEKTATSAP